MAQVRPKILISYGRISAPLRIPIIDLLVNAPATFLTSDTASGSATLNVKTSTDFGTNKFVFIGSIGSQGGEIIQVGGTGTGTISLSSSTAYPHSSSTAVRLSLYNQVEVSWSATTTGSKTVITTVAVDAGEDVTTVTDTTHSSGYYFARWKNSITGVFSEYADPAPYAGYTVLSARYIIDNALGEINKTTGEVLTDEFGFQQLNNFQKEVIREQKRWSFMESFDTNIGTTATGTWRVAAPTDLDDQFANRTIYNFRIGRGRNLTWVDKEKWNELTEDVAHTTLKNSISVGNSTITLTSSADFPTGGGTVQIGANQYTYTSNVQATGVLTLSVVSTTTNTAGEDVFFGASLGEPLYFTAFGGYIYSYPITSSSFTGRGYYMDYYKSLTIIALDSDNIVVPDETAASYYLQWKFLKKLNNGEDTEGSVNAMKMFFMRREKLKQKDTLGRSFRLKPVLNSLKGSSVFGDDDKRTRLGNFPDA